MANFPFKKLPPELLTRTFLIGAFDTETTALDGEMIYGTWQYERVIGLVRSDVMNCSTPDELLDGLIHANQPNMRWYAHNLEFDLLFILTAARERQILGEIGDIQLYERGLGNFFRCTITYYEYDLATDKTVEKKLELYDSMALFGFTLDVFAKNFSNIGHKHKIDWETESFNPANMVHIAYANQDTAILLDSMINFDAAIHKIYGVHCRGTISSTSLRAFQNFIPDKSKYFKPTEWQDTFSREGYFGGMCFLTDTNEKQDIVSLDINSMYPYCMRKYGVPAGSPTFAKKLPITQAIGLYRIEAEAPLDLKFGCLGYRDQYGVCWPRGKFETTAFSFEIERALRWGYKIKILNGIVWPRIDYIFEEFVTLCESQRAKHRGTAFEIVVKLIQNSLYGKFGTKIEGKEVMLFADQTNLDFDKWRPYLAEESGVCPIENAYECDTERDAAYMQPHWAAYVTARARGVLLDAYEKCSDSIFYGDTDSIKIDASKIGLFKTGADYGELKIDGQYSKFRAIAPKVYVFEKNEKLGGCAKGIPQKHHDAELWQKLFVGESKTVYYDSLGNLKTSLKNGGDRHLNKRHRETTNLQNSSSWWSDENGLVKSVSIIEGKRAKQ